MGSGKAKGGFAFVALVIAAVAGLYLSGGITLMLLKLDAPLKWNTWLEYWQALSLPDVAPYAKTIRIGGLVGFGLPLLLWLLLLVPLFKSRRPSTHGDARFATRSDLARLGLLKDDPQGIIVGKSGRRFLRMSGTRHALLAAPTRSGKGVGFVMPNLLDFRGSVVVLDIKQESFDISSGWRQQLGPVYLFNPFADDLRTHAWNPFDYVRTARTFRTSDLQAIADCLYKESAGQDPFWLNMARSTFVAMAGYLFDAHAAMVREIGEPGAMSERPTLGAIYRLLSGDGTDLKEQLQAHAAKDFVHADMPGSNEEWRLEGSRPSRRFALHALSAVPYEARPHTGPSVRSSERDVPQSRRTAEASCCRRGRSSTSTSRCLMCSRPSLSKRRRTRLTVSGAWRR